MKKYKYYKYQPSIDGYITWYLKTTSEKEAIRIIKSKCDIEGIPFYPNHLQPITQSQYNAYLIYLRSNLPPITPKTKQNTKTNNHPMKGLI